jgi:hypothetical protein
MFKFKKVFLVCFAVLSTSIGTISTAAPSAPKEIDQFVPSGTKLIDYQTADLNEDGKTDALIVVENIANDDISSQLPRTVLILLRKGNDQLVLADQNKNVYLCKKCLGTGYVNEQTVTLGKGNFSVFNQGGSPGFSWTREYTFQYSSNAKTWYLSKVKTGIFDTSNNDRSKLKELTYPKELQKMKFSRFNASKKWNATF